MRRVFETIKIDILRWTARLQTETLTAVF